MHTVQLLELATLPVGPGGKALEPTAGKETKCLFSSCDSRRSNSMDGGSKVLDRDRGEVTLGETQGANKQDSIKGENRSLLIRQGRIGEEGSHSQAFLRSKGQREGGEVGVKSLTGLKKSLFLCEDQDIINGNQAVNSSTAASSTSAGKWLARLDTLEVLDIWGKSAKRKVIQALIEGTMFGDFHLISVNIVPEGILARIWEKSKENTFACVWKELRTATTRGADPHTTTKSAEASEILFRTTKDLKRGLDLVTGRGGICDREEMMEGMGPKAKFMTGTKQHCPQSICNSEVGTFDRTVLVGSVAPVGRMA
ncbi:hypothetical protein IV203_010245 [Nitzschia inconspicua]|uniref:Uncharacterized protein n=1 Tax=Nitzschia inconspicua TaxID=303405 RepID=A0A9K3KVR0_9STRA|nr:hypothetical protein IV203_010245 [Nitzschia inconspicua]